MVYVGIFLENHLSADVTLFVFSQHIFLSNT